MFEYRRIMDLKEFTFDSLEQQCNKLAEDGWRVIQISDGSTNRYATLERDVLVPEHAKKYISKKEKELDLKSESEFTQKKVKK